MKVLKIIGISVLVIVVLIVSAFAAINFDLASVFATGSETLNPSGASIGRALVVYSPGFSGAAKQAATIIANNLKEKGYIVVLAGVRSGVAGDKTGYNVIVTGGPMYWGKVSNSINDYLKTLPNNVKLGVFGTTGSSDLSARDIDLVTLVQQVTSTTHNENAVIKLVLVGSEVNDCSDFVTKLLQ